MRIRGRRSTVVEVQGLDAIDGTPVLDLKPYVPAFDAAAGGSATVPEWMTRLMEGYFEGGPQRPVQDPVVYASPRHRSHYVSRTYQDLGRKRATVVSVRHRVAVRAGVEERDLGELGFGSS